jgi:hypothetical protein
VRAAWFMGSVDMPVEMAVVAAAVLVTVVL